MKIPENYRYIAFSAAYLYGDELWVSQTMYNALLKINIRTFDAEYISQFPEEHLGVVGLHTKALKWKDTLFFIPNNGRAIAAYNITKGSFIKLIPESAGQNGIQISCIAQKDNLVWLFPKRFEQPLYVFDMETMLFSEKEYWSSAVKKYIKDEAEVIFTQNVIFEDAAYMPICGTPYLIETPLTDSALPVIHNAGDGRKLDSIGYDGTQFYFSEVVGTDIIGWTPEKGIINKYIMPEGLEQARPAFYFSIICTEGDIFLLPRKTDDILIIDKTSDTINKLGPLPEEFRFFYKEREFVSSFVGHQLIGDELWIFPAKGNELIKINTRTKEIKGNIILLPEQITDESYREIVLSRTIDAVERGVIEENKQLTLDSYLDLIETNYVNNSSTVLETDTCGEKIYSYIKNMVVKQ